MLILSRPDLFCSSTYNTRGDYWVLDRTTKKLEKLGGDGAASTLMFAKFSPDGTRVGYVIDPIFEREYAAWGAIEVSMATLVFVFGAVL